eukprot:gnl/TRDRNA2_/TRDRNA2_140159_c0_seq2.p3 gnl/TRDRNA2_/TRDRNA2_140159_c0~~gnl/TRDRNA2_/TRDRNA2_140159_c0_seq2.p3  ORF type:complete len:159 (+),score=10.61 gnl/TRDRNA2_/TRDRNA2_140159_c0_seq2:141-617(+)
MTNRSRGFSISGNTKYQIMLVYKDATWGVKNNMQLIKWTLWPYILVTDKFDTSKFHKPSLPPMFILQLRALAFNSDLVSRPIILSLVLAASGTIDTPTCGWNLNISAGMTLLIHGLSQSFKPQAPSCRGKACERHPDKSSILSTHGVFLRSLLDPVIM